MGEAALVAPLVKGIMVAAQTIMIIKAVDQGTVIMAVDQGTVIMAVDQTTITKGVVQAINTLVGGVLKNTKVAVQPMIIKVGALMEHIMMGLIQPTPSMGPLALTI
jgi:hypothetical protein